MAPGVKFSSRIRILQLSTGKVTPHGHVLYQFGETSYSFLIVVAFVEFVRNQSGDDLHLLKSVYPFVLRGTLGCHGDPVSHCPQDGA